MTLRNPKQMNVAVEGGVSTGVKAGQLTQDNVGGSSTGLYSESARTFSRLVSCSKF